MKKSHFPEPAPGPHKAGGLSSRSLLLWAALLLLSGCAHYQYRLVEPAQYAQPITDKTTARISYPPLDYMLRERDDRLMIAIANPGSLPATLVGPQSYVVDPRGLSHPLLSATIAPHSYIALALPPEARPYYRPYPTVSLGFGYGAWWPGPGPFFGTGFAYPVGPGYYAPGPEPYSWEWKTGQVRMRLFYQQGGPTNTFEHQFLFDRVRVK